MNEHNSRYQQKASSEAITFKQALKIGALGGLAVMSVAEFQPAPGVTAITTVERTVPASPPREVEVRPLDELQIVMIDSPAIKGPEKYTKDYVKTVVNEADIQLRVMTDGEVTVPHNVPIHTLQINPESFRLDGSDNKAVRCYSDEQLFEVRDEYLKETQQQDHARVALIVNDANACEPAIAWAYTTGRQKMTVYDKGFDTNIFLHEEGHIDGLNHAAAIDCEKLKTPFNNEVLMARSKTDIGDLLKLGCEPRRSDDGSGSNSITDEYGSRVSAMGGYNDLDYLSDRYNFVELNQLAPDVVKNLDITAREGEYAVSLKDRDIHMVTLELPVDHPLRTVDPKIDKLSIGINREEVSRGIITPTVRLIATGSHMTYELAYAFPYYLRYDNSRENLEVYHDNTLGIKILLNPGVDDQTVNVKIAPLVDPTDQ